MKAKLTWLAGCLCLAVALWIGTDVSGGGYSGQSPMALNWRVTKPYPRDRDLRMEKRAKNPREEFEAARRRGLTEEEVMGIVEEFEELGITQAIDQNLLEEEYAKKGDLVRRWYCDALVEGFSLTEVQELVLKKVLRQVGKEDASSFGEHLERFRDLKDTTETGVLGFEEHFPIVQFGVNPLNAGSFGLRDVSPYKLIELDDHQKAMLGCHDEKGQWIWANEQQSTLDYGTDARYLYLKNPLSSINSIISYAGIIFPLSMEQADKLEPFRHASVSCHTPQVSTGVFLKQAKFLTAPQLRTLLIFHPDSARQLMMDLGAATNQ